MTEINPSATEREAELRAELAALESARGISAQVDVPQVSDAPVTRQEFDRLSRDVADLKRNLAPVIDYHTNR